MIRKIILIMSFTAFAIFAIFRLSFMTNEAPEVSAGTHEIVSGDVNSKTHGIDVSHYQANVNWKDVSDAGIIFAYLKATEGVNYVDPKFSRNFEAALKNGLYTGAYHFYIPSRDPKKQAEHYLKTVNIFSQHLPPVLDIERASKSTDPYKLIEGATIWLEHVQNETGCKPMVYASVNFWDKYLKAGLGDYHLWVAEYSSKLKGLKIDTKWHIWQYSQKGKVKGIDGNVDVNWFNGDIKVLEGILCR